MKLKAIILCMGVVGCLIFTGCGKSTSFSRNSHLALNDSNYFETRGLNFFVFIIGGRCHVGNNCP